MRCIIVGGGLAGMAAGVALQSAGVDVTIIESRKSLGGRAGSFEDPQTGEILDNCQHVLLGCCTNLIDFYRRIGSAHRIRWEDCIRFVDPRGRIFQLRATPGLPAPLHLAFSGLSFAALSIFERIALGNAMMAMLRLGTAGRKELADISFGQWLDQHHQPKSLVEKFFEIVLVSALNENCRDASAAAAIQVFQEGMLYESTAYRMGTPACPLAELYENFPVKDVRLGTRVSNLRFDGRRITGVEIQNETLDAEAVILAVNYPNMQKWIPAELMQSDERFGKLEELESVPILGAHLWFDRPVLDYPHVAMMRGPLQWLFRKGDDPGAMHGVISAAREWTGKSKEECLEIFTAQIRRSFAKAASARLMRGVIVIEKRATFSPRPGIDRIRPAQSPGKNGIESLFLAGDYTQSGWPATMEGAVRSGYLAAEGVLGKSGRFLVRDLPLDLPGRVVARS